jgi:ABC-type glycerol-3-phosphate transport system substrate-binding protein
MGDILALHRRSQNGADKAIRVRVLRTLGIIVLLLGSVMACTPAQSNPAPSTAVPNVPETAAVDTKDYVDQVVTVTFACSRMEHKQYQELADQFHALHPGIRINLVAVEDIAQYSPNYDHLTATRQIVSAADAADWQVRPCATREGLFLDLSPFFSAETTLNVEDFYPGMLENVQWDGGIWALPREASLTLLYYDRAAFDRAGVSYPESGWSRETFLRTAQDLTLQSDAEILQYGFVDYTEGLLIAITSKHVDRTLGHTGSIIPPEVATPDLAADLQWYVDLALRDGVMPNAAALESDWNQRARILTALVHGDFADMQDRGKAAMWTELLVNHTMNTHFHGSVGIAAYPDGLSGGLSLWTYTVSAGTPYPMQTWQWLAFLSQHKPPTFPDNIPARRSIAESTHYWARWTQEESDLLREALENPIIVHLGDAFTAVKRAVDEVLTGEALDIALDTAQRAVTDAYDLLSRTQPDPDHPVVVATREPGAPDTTVVTFATIQVTDYQSLAEAFNAENPDLRVEVVRPDQGRPSDCFLGRRYPAEETSRQDLLNLQPLIDTDAGFPLDTFHPRALSALSYQNDLWGIPVQATAMGIFYDRARFEAAGIPYPEPGWTLDAFTEAAIALTGDGEDGKRYGFVPQAHPIDLHYFLQLRGASLWDEAGNPRFDAPDVVAAVRWYTDLVRVHEAIPLDHQDRQTLIRRGAAAMWSGLAGDLYFDDSRFWPANADVRFAPLPVGERRLSNLDYEGFFIASSTPRVEACWAWFDFLVRQALPVRGVPAQLHYLAADELAKSGKESRQDAYLALFSYEPFQVVKSDGFRSQWNHFEGAIEDILQKGMSVEAALANAQQEAQ